MKKQSDTSKNILIAFILNFSFVFIEILGGLFTNSIAILSDAVHDLGDSAAIACAYVFERLSEKKPNDKYTFGYKRYSLLSSIITALILILGGAWVIFNSVVRILNPQRVNAPGMIIIAVVGVIINGAAVIKTHKTKNSNEKLISLHMLEDVLGWAAVLVGSLVMWLFDFDIIDPILSIAISLFILSHAVKNIINVVSTMLEKAPSCFDISEYKKELLKIDNVIDIHHVHIWSLDGITPVATIHVVVPKDINVNMIESVKHSITEESLKFGVKHITVQIDFESLFCHEKECEIHSLHEHHSHSHHVH